MGKRIGYILWLAFAVAGNDLLQDMTEAMRGETTKEYQHSPTSNSYSTKQHPCRSHKAKLLIDLRSFVDFYLADSQVF